MQEMGVESKREEEDDVELRLPCRLGDGVLIALFYARD